MSDILIWRGPNFEKITREICARRRIAIWGLRSAQIKKLKKTDPNFFSTKMLVCSLQLFDQSTPKASNCDPTARVPQKWYVYCYGARKVYYYEYMLRQTTPSKHNWWLIFLSIQEVWKGVMGSQVYFLLILLKYIKNGQKGKKNCSDDKMCIKYF